MIEVIDRTEAEPAKCLPRDAKPSELVRGWPKDRWCKSFGKNGERRCAGGILAEFAGFDWTRSGVSCGNDAYVLPFSFVVRAYGIPEDVLDQLWSINDFAGKDAAADYLEAAGF